MEQAVALQAVQQQANGTAITVAQVQQLLANVKGVTFANITQVTQVALAAAHKDVDIKKVTIASVQLFNNLKEFTSVYANAVKRKAEQLGISSEAAIESFVPQGNYFEHTDCYSIVKHKTQEKFYLYAIYNKAESLYVKGNNIVSKEFVAAHMAPAAAKKLLEPEDTVHNVTQDVTHNVHVRTVGMESIVQLVAMKQQLTV